MSDALTPEGRVLLAEDAHPLVVFAMSLAHPGDTARIIAEEEEAASALIGALPCSAPHGRGGAFPHEVEMTPAFTGPCPSCGAAV